MMVGPAVAIGTLLVALFFGGYLPPFSWLDLRWRDGFPFQSTESWKGGPHFCFFFRSSAVFVDFCISPLCSKISSASGFGVSFLGSRIKHLLKRYFGRWSCWEPLKPSSFKWMEMVKRLPFLFHSYASSHILRFLGVLNHLSIIWTVPLLFSETDWIPRAWQLNMVRDPSDSQSLTKHGSSFTTLKKHGISFHGWRTPWVLTIQPNCRPCPFRNDTFKRREQ